MARSKNYKDLLIQSLKDPEEAIGYLNAVLDEYRDGDEESKKLLMNALKNITEAQGGISKLSTKTGLRRESLYKTLSLKSDPKFNTLTIIAHGLGFDLKFCLPPKR